MATGGLFVMMLFPVVLILGGAAAVVAGRRRARSLVFDEAAYPGLRGLRQSTVGYRLAGLAVGILVGVGAFAVGALKPLAFSAPLLAASAVIVAIIVGQRSAYGGARVAGSAGVERRRLADYLPRRPALRAAGAASMLIAVAVFTTLAASPDDMGRAGRAVEVLYQDGEAFIGSGRSPFPGGYYTWAVAAALVLLLAVAALGLVETVRRPRNGADPELVRVDDALRRITAEGIVAAVAVGASGSLFGISFVASSELLRLGPVPLAVASGVLMAAFAALGVAGLFAAGVVLLVPRDAGTA